MLGTTFQTKNTLRSYAACASGVAVAAYGLIWASSVRVASLSRPGDVAVRGRIADIFKPKRIRRQVILHLVASVLA